MTDEEKDYELPRWTRYHREGTPCDGVPDEVCFQEATWEQFDPRSEDSGFWWYCDSCAKRLKDEESRDE